MPASRGIQPVIAEPELPELPREVLEVPEDEPWPEERVVDARALEVPLLVELAAVAAVTDEVDPLVELDRDDEVLVAADEEALADPEEEATAVEAAVDPASVATVVAELPVDAELPAEPADAVVPVDDVWALRPAEAAAELWVGPPWPPAAELDPRRAAPEQLLRIIAARTRERRAIREFSAP